MKLTNKQRKVYYTAILANDIVLKDIKKGEHEKILDFGCGDGLFTKELLAKSKVVHGCDLDETIILENENKADGVRYNAVTSNTKLPYLNHFFDCVTMMGVLEHVRDERETLAVISKMLNTRGVLYLYILNKGVFGFMDSANLKFRFPGLHKLLYSLFYGKETYSKEFVDKKKSGMMGDFTLGKTWHTHYSLKEIIALLGSKFIIEKVWYYSLFLPIILIIDFVYVSFLKRHSKLISKLINLDNKISLGPLSYSMVVKCRKVK